MQWKVRFYLLAQAGLQLSGYMGSAKLGARPPLRSTNPFVSAALQPCSPPAMSYPPTARLEWKSTGNLQITAVVPGIECHAFQGSRTAVKIEDI